MSTSAMSGVAVTVEEIKSQEPPKEPPPADPVVRGERMTIERAMELTGTTTPSAALRAAKEQNAAYGYLPHVGAKQRAKALRRQAKVAAQASV